jgi:hypothetical protein
LTNGFITEYKIDIKPIIEAMASKGIQLIKPVNINPEILVGEAWNLSKFLNSNTPLVPRESLIYQNNKEETSVTFLNYSNTNGGIDEDEDVEFLRQGIENVCI